MPERLRVLQRDERRKVNLQIPNTIKDNNKDPANPEEIWLPKQAPNERFDKTENGGGALAEVQRNALCENYDGSGETDNVEARRNLNRLKSNGKGTGPYLTKDYNQT